MKSVVMSIEINGMAYAPVGPSLDQDDEWLVSTREMGLDREVRGIFEDYLSRVITKDDTNRVSVGYFEDEDSGTKPRLDELLTLELSIQSNSDDYDTLEDAAESFTQRLNNKMLSQSSEGVLFTIQAERDGDGKFIGFLKLDLDNEQRSMIDEDTHQLIYEELDDVLPEPDSLQKGATYPVLEEEGFDLTGDVKFLQEDSPSKYFQKFLGCVTSSGSLKQMQHALEAVDEMMQTRESRTLHTSEVERFEDRAKESGGLIDKDDLHSAASDVIGPTYDRDEYEQKLFEKGEEQIRIDPDNSPKKVKWILDGEIEITAPVDLIDDDRLQIEEPDNLDGEYVITVRGSTCKKSFQK